MTTLQHNSRVAYQRRDRDNNAVGAPLLGSVERVTKTAVYFKNDATGKTYGAPKDRVYPLTPALDKSIKFLRDNLIHDPKWTRWNDCWIIRRTTDKTQYWSITIGWTQESDAHIFSKTDKAAQTLPLEGEWITTHARLPVALQQLVNGEAVV